MDQYDVFVLDLYHDAMHRSFSAFSENWFARLKKTIHFDSAGIADCVIGPERQFIMESVQLHATSAERFHDRAETVGNETARLEDGAQSKDVLLTSAFAQRGVSAVIDIAATFSQPEILRYCRKYETAHALAFISNNAEPHRFCGISLWRADKRRAYQAIERHLATRLLSHVAQARQVSQCGFPRENIHSVDSAGTLCDLAGNLYFASPAAIRLLQLEWTQWEPSRLPEQLMHALRTSQDRSYSGRMLSVRGRLDGGLMKLSLVKRDPLAQLTPAELRVALLAAEGNPYKAIARELAVSPATVRNQLHTIYRKLNVPNKAALAMTIQERHRGA